MRSGKRIGDSVKLISCLNDSEIKERGLWESKSKTFPRGACPSWTPLEACTFGTHLGKLVSIYPFKPKDPHTNSPDWSPYISFKKSWENRSKHSPFGNQFSNSHNLYSWWSVLMMLGENWCWSLLGPKGFRDSRSRPAKLIL